MLYNEMTDQIISQVILTFDNSRQLVPGYSDRQYQLLTKVIW